MKEGQFPANLRQTNPNHEGYHLCSQVDHCHQRHVIQYKDHLKTEYQEYHERILIVKDCRLQA